MPTSPARYVLYPFFVSSLADLLSFQQPTHRRDQPHVILRMVQNPVQIHTRRHRPPAGQIHLPQPHRRMFYKTDHSATVHSLAPQVRVCLLVLERAAAMLGLLQIFHLGSCIFYSGFRRGSDPPLSDK